MLLELDQVAKTFPNGTVALAGVDLRIEAGTVHGLLGANGAGKSTLIKILSGALSASGGAIRWKDRPVQWKTPRDPKAAGVATLYQHIPLVPTLSALENILLDGGGFSRRRAADRERIAAIVAHVGSPFALDDKVADLAIGARQMVCIVQALASGADLVVMDEPTASLAGHERQAVYDVIRRLARDEGKTVLFVSHFIDEIISLTDEVTVLRDGRAVLHAKTNDLDEAAIAAAIAGRAVTALERPAAPRPAGEVLVSVRDLASPGQLKPVSFDIRKGEILGVAGVLGSGRSELLHALFGADPRARGEVRLKGRPVPRYADEAVAAGLALVPEDRARQGYVPQFPIWKNVSLPHISTLSAAAAFPKTREERALADAVVARIGIRTRDIDTLVTDLSGGNAQKTVIGKWLTPQTQFLLLDEPTAGIDIGARTDILRLIRALADDGLPVLLVSSEFEDLLAVCDRILVMRDHALVAERPALGCSEADLILLAGGTRPGGH